MLNFRNSLVLAATLLVSACGTDYLTSDGERLIGNTALGCVAGEVIFGKCAEGAVIAGGATVITDQK